MYLFVFKGIYYFDLSGKSFSLPNGIQKYIDGKQYRILIKTYIPITDQNISVTYIIQVNLPVGISLVASLQ